MAAFDELPPALRAALDYSICDFNACTLLARYQTGGEPYALELIRRSENADRRQIPRPLSKSIRGW